MFIYVNILINLDINLHTLLSVPVCKVAWYDDSNSFVAGFMDGVICLGTKQLEDQIKIVEAHKVSTKGGRGFTRLNPSQVNSQACKITE